ncbi:hypothetical protein [Catellatospora vulcania]|uniref:hypothetical protein n=1 Tax=Catellatospora vulcania TaxID=1460450 RepID=UPI001E4DD746|nr:hypothetical protein [Catellatospora vulcania]
MAERGEEELDRHLGALVDHGSRIGRLGSAEQVRRRGERRRRNTRLAAAASGLAVVAVFAGVYATQTGHGTPDPPVATQPARASASASPSPVVTPKVDPSAVPGDGVPEQDQGVWVQATTTGGYPLLTALPDNTLSGVGEAAATEGARFALVPLTPGGTAYALKTATAASWGEPGCAERNGSRLTIEACNAARDEQVVTLRGSAAPYELVLGGQALKVTETGVSAVAPGQGTPLTFIVRGTAQGRVG